MAEAKTKLPVKDEGKQAEQASALREWRPFETLRREIDRVFDDFGGGFWRSPVPSLGVRRGAVLAA